MTTRRLLHAAWLGLWALLLAGALLLARGVPVAGHGGGAGLEVEPSTVTAGGTVTLVGENLEPNDERVLVLTGADVRLDLGTVTTDAEGMFSIEITIPAHLPAGVYHFLAIGDETLTVDCNILAAPGMEPSSSGPPAADEPEPREASVLGLALVLGVAAVALAVGGLLVARAERIGRFVHDEGHHEV